ncbi:hypothetical protein BZG36_04607 [Bifiguratus adelaidae]|uniref:CN hydrolase domain-containing protein n=1 Tax=Bifiguratus adelaidae TaxID=1938954 RepID=A0A261XXH8_9FUNG|nr:hypothetical protein BZG36_04607 [Bifiguratus adelaidae]
MVKVAIVQLCVVDKAAPPTQPLSIQQDTDAKRDLATNLKTIERFLGQAKEQQADIVVFPEYSLFGVISGREHLADTDKSYVKLFQELAQKYQVDLVPGTIVEKDKEDGKLYNYTYYIDKSGEILLTYAKYHLWHPERDYMTASKDGYKVAQTRHGIKVGLCICWDAIAPEIFRDMCLEHGAQLIICPAYWTFDDCGEKGLRHNTRSEMLLLNSLCPTRAIENNCAFVFVNAANNASATPGEDPEEVQYGVEHLLGRSQICVPFKGAIGKCDHDRQAMLIREVDLDLIHDAEDVYKIRRDWKDGLIYRATHTS